MKYFSRDKIKDHFFLLLIAIIAYWPVSFMLLSVKNDAINYFLAMRCNTSEAIQYNYFPSWSAYINMGYPLHADMQSGVWNPVVFFMSLIRKYDIYWLHIETIVVIFLSGISMYHLLKHFGLNRKLTLAIASAYMLNGYMTDAGQFLNWMYAAAFLPFVFLCAVRCFSSFKTRDAFLLGFAHALMLLCSYPADFILLSYILITFVLASFFRHGRNYTYKDAILKFGKQTFVTAVTFIIICLPAILSYVPFINSITRGSGVDIDTALSNSLAPANFISFITPWATQKGVEFYPTDPLIRNCYMGILLFVFFIFFFLQKTRKTFVQKFLIGLFIFFVIFSLGQLGGLRVISYYALPLMNTFRHPANAKLFFIFAGQILAAFAIQHYLQNNNNKGLLKKLIAVLLVIMGIVAIFSFVKSNLSALLKSFFSTGSGTWSGQLKSLKDNLSFYDMLFLNAAVLFPFLLLFHRFTRKDQLARYLLPLVVIEMIVIAQGMLPLTYVRKTSPAVVQQILTPMPKGYPLPDNRQSIREHSTEGMKYFDQVGCLNPYNKKPGRSDYIISPANLSTQEFFWDYVSFREKVIDYPLVYFADTIYATKDTLAFINAAPGRKACIADIANAKFTVSTTGKSVINLRKFAPGSVSLETENDKEAFLVLLQNKYYNWKVYVNGEEKPIITTNLSFMGVHLAAGNNKVDFIYKTGPLKYLGIFSLLFIAAGLIFISYSKRENLN